jgi:hypothetical protein
MTNNSHNFIHKLNALKHVRLSSVQKDAMRSTLISYADMHEVQSNAPELSGLKASPYTAFFFSRAFISAALIIVLIVSSGVGVTYAAGNSLPGQPLYAIKVNVAEPIQGALITSATGKADWQNELAERRLAEATTLAADNNLSSSTQAYLAAQAALHIQESENDSAQLADNGQGDSALAVRSDLEARLGAHARLLALLDAHLAASGDATTSDEVALLLQKVSQDQTTVSMSREASEVAISGNASTTPNAFAPAATSTTAGRATIAFIAAQNASRHTEEQKLFMQNALRLGLISSTSASSTASSTASTTPKHNHKGNNQDQDATSTATSGESSTTIEINVPSSN